MKKLLLTLAFMSLGGCAAFTPTPFDNNLYDHVVNVNILVKNAKANCGTVASFYMVYAGSEMLTVKEYLKHRAGNDDLVKATNLIKKDIDSYNNIKQPSVTYCVDKTGIIESELNGVLDAIGGKPQ